MALLGVSLGLVGQISSVVSEAGSELTVVQRIPKGLPFGYLGTLSDSVVDGLRSVPGVARASPLILVPASITREIEGMGKSVGDSISVNTRELPIVGIYRSGVSLEDGGAMMTLAAARKFFGLRERVSLVKVKADDPRQVGAVQAAWAVSVIALLLSVLAVANTMAMTVLARTRLPFPTSVAPTLLAGAMGVGVVGGFLPAWRAARLDPVQALRAV